MACDVFGAVGDITWPTVDSAPTPAAGSFSTTADPPSFLDDLAFAPVNEHFVHACAQIVAGVTKAPTAEGAGADAIRVRSALMRPRVLRITIANDSSAYVRTTIRVGRPLARLDVLTAFPCMPIEPHDDRFTVRVPGRGVVVVRAWLTGPP